MECFRLLFDHLAWIEHQFLRSIRDSRKAGCLWGMMRGVGGVRKSIQQSWLAKGFGLGLLCWGFKGAQEKIPSQETSTLQIGSVAFPLGQCTSPQLQGCPRGVMVKAMHCGIVVGEFVLQSRYYVHFRANTLGKGMNPLILPPAMGKIVGRTRFFSLGEATSLGEGKLWIQTC